MKMRVPATIGVAVVSFGLLGACGSGDEEPEADNAAAEPVGQEPEETVELDPEKMTGRLTQDQSVVFTEYVMEQFDIGMCETVGADLDPGDIDGVINLMKDLAGYEQGIEHISQMGVSIAAREACDY